MADNENKTGPSLGIPQTTPKPEKRPTFSAAGKANHVDHQSRGGAFKTFLWVAPLTALIWIYAEREQIDRAEFRVQIKVVSKGSDKIITALTPADGIVLDVEGPKASLNEMRDLVSKPVEVRLDEAVGYEGDISIVEPINKSDLFTSHAVTVKAARPAVRIKVQAKGSKRVPVRPRPEDKLVGPPPAFEPDTVLVEGPKDTLDKIDAKELVAYADLSTFASKPPGSYVDDVPIALRIPYIENVTMKDTVRAKVEISKSAPYQISAIPIVLQINSAIVTDDKFKITAPPTLRGVDVIGPADAIDSLKQFKFPAAVVLDFNDEKRFPISDITTTRDLPVTLRPGDYRMPKDVTVLNPNRDITITITRRSAG
ncbi:MAG TPA: CdaR family protein [Tepidisphaeraceae bacterium]|jgi:hypothetical protein|nr:CdaR family protein [Tepidisphaeraceae bacterium]